MAAAASESGFTTPDAKSAFKEITRLILSRENKYGHKLNELKQLVTKHLAYLNERDHEGNTLLNWLAEQHQKCWESFQECTSLCDIKRLNGLFMKSNFLNQVVRLLLDSGVDPSLSNRKDTTPLMRYAQTRDQLSKCIEDKKLIHLYAARYSDGSHPDWIKQFAQADELRVNTQKALSGKLETRLTADYGGFLFIRNDGRHIVASSQAGLTAAMEEAKGYGGGFKLYASFSERPTEIPSALARYKNILKIRVLTQSSDGLAAGAKAVVEIIVSLSKPEFRALIEQIRPLGGVTKGQADGSLKLTFQEGYDALNDCGGGSAPVCIVFLEALTVRRATEIALDAKEGEAVRVMAETADARLEMIFHEMRAEAGSGLDGPRV